MRIFLLIAILTFSFEIDGQDTSFVIRTIDSIEVNNIKSSNLLNGFYRVIDFDRTICKEKFDTFYRAYQQYHKHFLFFRKTRLDSFMYVKGTIIIDTINAKFDRKLINNGQSFEIVPRPIAIFNNITKIAYSKTPHLDSSKWKGISIKLNFLVNDSLDCGCTEGERCSSIGLVIDNQLVSISDYCKFVSTNNGKFHYAFFYFPTYSIVEIKAIYSLLKPPDQIENEKFIDENNFDIIIN